MGRKVMERWAGAGFSQCLMVYQRGNALRAWPMGPQWFSQTFRTGIISLFFFLWGRYHFALSLPKSWLGCWSFSKRWGCWSFSKRWFFENFTSWSENIFVWNILVWEAKRFEVFGFKHLAGGQELWMSEVPSEITKLGFIMNYIEQWNVKVYITIFCQHVQNNYMSPQN